MLTPNDGKSTSVTDKNDTSGPVNAISGGGAMIFGQADSNPDTQQAQPQLHQAPVLGHVDNTAASAEAEAAVASSIGLHQPLTAQQASGTNPNPHQVFGIQVPLNGNDAGSNPTTQMYMNMNQNGAAQAFAAAAMAAQQIVQAQMGMGGPAQQHQNSAGHGSNIAFNQGHVTGNLVSNATGVDPKLSSLGAPISAVNHALQNSKHQVVGSAQPHYQQQNPIALQAQAQAAAILAASGLGPNNIFNQSQNGSAPAIAAAQAFALMMQQQSQANQNQLQGQMASSTMLQASAPSNTQSLQQLPHLLQSSQGAPQANTEIKSDPVKPQSPQPTPSQQQVTSPPQNRILQTVKQQKLKQQQATTSEKDLELPKITQTSTLPSTHQVRYSPATSSINVPSLGSSQQVKTLKSSFQMSSTTPPLSASLAPVHHNAIGTSQHSQNSNLFQAAMNPIVLSQMQSWKLNQLESHVQLLNDTNQPVPQPVQILLSEARRLEEKRAAKRIANRKSACTSRARKKALVAEMTKTNARLRRQAIILSLLPDLVIAIKDDGTITFCSAQVERVLRHKLDDLVGSKIGDVLTPSSRLALATLIEKLVAAEKVALEDGNHKGDESGRSSNSGGTSQAAIVSEQSDNFPLSIVKVKSHNPATTNDASDSSGNGNNAGNDVPLSHVPQSSLTNQSNSDGSSNPHGNDGSTGTVSNNSGVRKGAANSDVDSSSSSDTKKLNEANDALSRNVRFHNEQLKIKKDSKKKCIAHKDDVTGDSVTANNADARLSSLMKQRGELEQSGALTEKKVSSASNLENLEVSSSSSSTDSLLAGVEDRHKKRKRSDNNVSDDSGYRESGESDPSREDSASSTSDTSNGGRPRPLAPTCNICLIRDDLTTIWCEVTSSIRTRSLDEEQLDASTVSNSASSNQKKSKAVSSNNGDEQASINENTQTKELLLCLRPIRDGVEKVSEDLRFVPSHKQRSVRSEKVEPINASNGNADANSSPTVVQSVTGTSKVQNAAVNERRPPMKKRPLPLDGGSQIKSMGELPSKKQSVERQENDAEKSVVESLILMSSN